MRALLALLLLTAQLGAAVTSGLRNAESWTSAPTISTAK